MTSKSCSIPGGSANPVKGSEMNSRSASPIRAASEEEGVYSNSEFMRAITPHIGKDVILRTQNGQSFVGIFCTFSKTFEVVIGMAHLIDGPPGSFVEKLIFRPQDILSLELKNIDVEFETKDTPISQCGGQRDLEPWQDPGCNEDERLDDELGVGDEKGWDVDDMFKKNEKMGIKSTFDEEMVGYTMKIDRSDSSEFREAEARATKIAKSRSGNNKIYSRVFRGQRKDYKLSKPVIVDQNTVVSNNVTGSTSSGHQIDTQAFRQRKNSKKDHKLSRPQTKGSNKEPAKRSALNPNAKEFACTTPQTEPAFRMPYLPPLVAPQAESVFRMPQGHLSPQPYQQQLARMGAPQQSSAGDRAMVPTAQEDYSGAGPRMHQFMGPQRHCNGRTRGSHHGYGYGQGTSTPLTPTYPMIFPPPNLSIPPPPPPQNMMTTEQGYNMNRRYRNGGPM